MWGIKIDFGYIITLCWPVNFVVVLGVEFLKNVVCVLIEMIEMMLTSRRARIKSFSGALNLTPYR